MSSASLLLMTAEEMFALPDNGMERELIEGRLRERPMALRSRRHARCMAQLARHLCLWVERLPLPRGEVLAANAGFCLRRNPDTAVGIDVAYVSSDLAKRTPDDAYLIEGAPLLAAEVLAPSDTHEDVIEKIGLYLKLAVEIVWILDPDLRTVTVHRPEAEPVLFGARQDLVCEPELSGFRAKIADLFAN